MIRIAADIELHIGESLVWDERRGWLWFVDILKNALYAHVPGTGALHHFEMPASIGSLGLIPDGKLVVALRNGVHVYDPDTGALDLLVHPEPERTSNRLNDGKVGPDGAFWMGSMSEAQPYEPTGSLYRITPDGGCTTIRKDLYVSNGIDWSPDGTTMYHADSVPGEVLAYDFDRASGTASNPRSFAKLLEPLGRPDGAAVDVDGCYWSAGVSGGRLNQISPDGQTLQSIELPCAAPTMACFGGEGLRTMYVTSLTRGDDVGRLYAMDVGTSGLQPFLFGTGDRAG